MASEGIQNETITSAANPLVKLLRSLERKKGRREHDLFLAEGVRLVEEALSHGWTPVYAVHGRDGLIREASAKAIQALQAHGARVEEVTDRLLGQIARKENPQTIVAAFRPQTAAADVPADTPAGTWLALYEVRDPGNLGTILRTADFAGVRQVFLVGDCCDPFSLECVRASMGSIFAVSIVMLDRETFEAMADAAKMPLIAASMHGKWTSDSKTFGAACILLMGNEQKGLPGELEDKCDVLLRLPMRAGADSLNLATATALLVYKAWEARGYDGAS